MFSHGHRVFVCLYSENWHSRCVTVLLLVLEILCSSTKLMFVLMLSALCIFHAYGCALSVYNLKLYVESMLLLSI